MELSVVITVLFIIAFFAFLAWLSWKFIPWAWAKYLCAGLFGGIAAYKLIMFAIAQL